MILTTLTDCERYVSLHPLFKTLFDYLKSHDLQQMPLGRIDILGDDLFINNSEPECIKAEDQVLEVHRRYIDVHLLLTGEETVGWLPLADCKAEHKPYDADSDYGLYADQPSTYFTLRPGMMLLVWPEDPHAPIIGQGKIRKAIAKVKVS